MTSATLNPSATATPASIVRLALQVEDPVERAVTVLVWVCSLLVVLGSVLLG